MDRFDNQQRAIAILHIGGVDRGADHQTAGIGRDMPFAAFDLLGGIPRVAAVPRPRTGSAARSAALGGLDGLTIDHPSRRARLATGSFARLQQQFEIDPLEQTTVPPIVEVALQVVNGAKSFGSKRH